MLNTLNKVNDKLDSLLSSIEPKIRKAFITMIEELKSSAVFPEILRLLENGQIDAAISIVEKQVTGFSNRLISFYAVAGATAAETLTHLGILVSFDQTNFRAVRIMQEARLRLIRELTERQREAIRSAMVSGISQGLNPKIQAGTIKEAIGLTAKQVKAVENYRRLLNENSVEALTRRLRDGRFDSTVRNNTVLTQDQIDRMVARYIERQLVYRAETIARTEAIRAVNMGSEELYKQAVESGDLDPTELEYTWWTAHDERVRGSHASMHGQKRTHGEPFISGDGNILYYPGDPNAPASEVINCRCRRTLRIKPINQ